MEQNKFSKAEWIKTAVGLVLIVVGIILINTLGWLKVYEDFDMGTLLVLAGVGVLIWTYLGLVPEREAKVYVTSDGNPDTTTRRHYVARKLLPLQGFISRGCKFAIPKSTLQSFTIDNGVVTIMTKSGRTLTSPLDELLVKYHTEKGEISGFTIQKKDSKEKITIYTPGILFEDDEWKDVAGVLSAAAVVKESAMSKMSKIVESAHDFDASDLANSAYDIAESGVKYLKERSKAAKVLADFATKSDEEDAKPTSLWGKIKNVFTWILAIIFVLYIAFNIWMQIAEHNAQFSDEIEYVYSNYDEEDGEDVEVVELEETVPNYLDFDDGYNKMDGFMTKGNKRYPFTLEFFYNANSGEFGDVVYTNRVAGTQIQLDAYLEPLEDGDYRFRGEGYDQGKDFLIYFFYDGSFYTGSAYWGSSCMDLELYKAIE